MSTANLQNHNRSMPFTPVVSNLVNCSAVTVEMIVFALGNHAFVFFRAAMTVTASAALTSFDMTLPFPPAVDFTSADQVMGDGSVTLGTGIGGGLGGVGEVGAVTSSKTCQAAATPLGTGAVTFSGEFGYLIE